MFMGKKLIPCVSIAAAVFAAAAAVSAEEPMNEKKILNMNQFSKKEILEWIELMKLLKDARTRNAVPQLFKNQSLGMIFQQNSTRTRVSFETAATLLGGHALMLGAGDIHLGKKETVEDTARVLARMVDVIMIRTDKYADIERFA